VSTFRQAMLLSFASMLFVECASAQESTGEKKNNLYSAAVLASLDEMEKSWGHLDDSKGLNRIRTDYGHMFVVKDAEITDALPSQFGDHQVEYLDGRAQLDRYKTLRKEFPILKIHPMQTEGDRLTISVSVSYVEYEKRKLRLALSDWSEVEFHFDCNLRQYVISSVKLGGI
jgi:hypothetical protein